MSRISTKVNLLSSLALLLIINASATSTAAASPLHPVKKLFQGMASIYGDALHGHKTASGQRYDCNKLTCAHPSLPFGTKLLVTNPETGSECIVIVNDRGPYAHNRVIDLSRAAARALHIKGVGHVLCSTVHDVAKKAGNGGKGHTIVASVPDKQIVAPGDQSTIATAH